MGYATIGTVQAILVVCLFLSLPLWKKFEVSNEADEEAHSDVKVSTLIKLPGAKPALISFFCYCAIELTTGLWTSSLLVTNNGLSAESAAKWVSLYYLGITVGRFLSGFIAMKLNNKQLENVLFPIGNLEKSEVREIAKKYDLITATKKDSTGICFIGERNFKSFLENYLPNIPGNIINIETNEKLGTHIGLMYYTIGQRKGLNLGGNDNRTFVVGKNLDKNILYVACGDENEYLYTDSALIEQMNWISDYKPNKCTAKFRYRQKDNDVEIEIIDEEHILVKYPQGVKSVTPGQACVLYNGEECLGGGIIKEVYKKGEKTWYL